MSCKQATADLVGIPSARLLAVLGIWYITYGWQARPWSLNKIAMPYTVIVSSGDSLQWSLAPPTMIYLRPSASQSLATCAAASAVSSSLRSLCELIFRSVDLRMLKSKCSALDVMFVGVRGAGGVDVPCMCAHVIPWGAGGPKTLFQHLRLIGSSVNLFLNQQNS